MSYHIPVMLNECVEALNINPNGIYVDLTYGGGGHSREILKNINSGMLYAFDKDTDALQNIIQGENFQLINSDFRYLKHFMKYYNVDAVDGIFADLGVSSFQFDQAERGFSTRFEGPLDLRMDRRKSISARDIIYTYNANQLQDVFSQYGEVRNSKKLANVIVSERNSKNIQTTQDFIEAIDSCIDKRKQNKYLAQVFQALRIEVNQELESLKIFLESSADLLKSGGRLVVLSYHSLEDRLVKNFIKSGNFDGIVEKDFYGKPNLQFEKISRKPITASEEEIKENPRARSAKLRIAEKI
jgi:16S rRNA (cytosine1402-N4)-methyltransferase